jgi:hypothetical protein
MSNNYKFKLLISVLVIFGLAFICSSNKETTTDKKEDTKKEETKKEETKTEDTKKETTTIAGGKLYFCEEYRNGDYDNTIYQDTERDWVWFYKQITFYKPGNYSIDVYDSYGSRLVTGYVKVQYY